MLLVPAPMDRASSRREERGLLAVLPRHLQQEPKDAGSKPMLRHGRPGDLRTSNCGDHFDTEDPSRWCV